VRLSAYVYILIIIVTTIPELLRVKQNLRDCPSKATSTAFPTFLYPSGAYDPTDGFKGLLRSEVLVYVSLNEFRLKNY
jgi:Family of unknown function (DUF6698)